MKALIFLILAVGTGFVAYNYAYPPVMNMFGISMVKDEPRQEVAVITPPPAPMPEKKPEPPPPPPPEPKPEPKPEPMPEKKMEPPPPPPEPEKPKDEFVPPKFDTVEVVTANWSAIPKGFFTQPKAVKMNKDLDIQMKLGAGSANMKVPAGGTVYAISQDGGSLVIAPAVNSPGRASVPLDDTDIKAVFTAAYDQVNAGRIDAARREWDARKLAESQPKKAAAAPSVGIGALGKPEKDAEGKYPLLIASMKAGQVTEIKPEKVKEWGDPKNEKIDGANYWTVVVKYETETMFGKFETEAQARVKDGRVDKWVYVGSGEVVP